MALHLMRVERRIQKEVPGLGEKIRIARKLDRRSLKDLAKLADMSIPNWYAIEKEETKVLPEPTLRKIEEILGVDLGVQFNGSGNDL